MRGGCKNMPIIKSAKKKLRQDKKKSLNNKKYEFAYKKLVNQARKHKKTDTAIKTHELLKKAYSAIDKAAKKKIIHKNKAGRLKARISRLLKK